MFDISGINSLFSECNQLEEYTAYLSTRGYKSIDLLQVSNGMFYSRYRTVRLDKFSVSAKDVESAYISRLSTDINSYRFNFYESPKGFFINGERVGGRSLFLIKPNQDLLITSHANSKYFSISIEKKVLNEYLDVSDLMFHEAFALQVSGTDSLSRLFYDMMHGIIFNKEKLSRQDIKNIEEEGLHTVVQMLHKDNVLQMYPSTHYRIVRRAQEYIDSHYSSTLSVLDVYKYSHCSLRTLEHAFKKVLGLTPKSYLILLRMHSIRKEIINHSGVNGMALLDKYGVQNRSRFYSDYRQLFGEDPRSKFE
jgi:AraC-like DNA-binding protein